MFRRLARLPRPLLLLSGVLLATCVAAVVLFSSLNVGQELLGPAGVQNGSVSATANPNSRVLPVPYLSQGNTHWCFVTSLSMVLSYDGDKVSPSTIASAMHQGSGTGSSVLDLLAPALGSYVSKFPDLSVRRDLLRNWTFADYKYAIDTLSSPVIVSSFGFPGHTVVVVGYSVENGKRYVYVNDPSGYLTKIQWKTNGVSYAKVPWEQLSAFSWTRPLVMHTLIVRK